MAETSQYAPGTPIWVDLGSPDPAAAATFYGQLLGWQTQDLGAEAGGYRFFTRNGQVVAGVGPLMAQGQPPAWSTYIKTEDADATARKVREAGGRVLAEPFDVMSAGRMAVFMDPTGAAISVWQPRDMQGAQLFNEPGSVCWNELNTRDLESAKRFYPRVFGWDVDAHPFPGGEYVEWKLNGRSVAGAQPMPSAVPAQVPSFWMTYFAVDDCDATVSKAQSLGARVQMPGMDIEQGRFAVLTDPQGAAFSVIKLKR